ncbi:MAG: vWA domain-containing protein [Coriobacteriales bacterium]|jgi:Ca-activated chloride channel family protein
MKKITIVLICAVCALAVACGFVLAGCEPYEPAAKDIAVVDGPGAAGAEAIEVEGYAATADSMAYEEAYAINDGSYDIYYPDYNTEEYSHEQEQRFLSTKTSPLSTVSADVDTASYCNLRRMAETGFTPEEVDAGAVRIEEMLNYFDYGYASPTGDDRFSMQASIGPCPWNKNTELLVMGFATAEEERDTSKGSNLVFLIDTSGSMDESDKLPLLQDSFAVLVDELDENDRISIVTYAGEERVVLEGAKGDEKRKIQNAIDSLYADGSTNGEAGLKMAYDVAENNFIKGGVNRIIMASDGDLNVGMTSESELHDFVDGKRETGIYLSVLGFGTGNYKDNKMETLADHGNGQYHYIDCRAEARRVFSENLTANLVPFADDVKVQVEFNPAQVKGYRLIGYENRAMADEDFRNDEADAGEIGPDSQFTVAYEIVPADSSFEIPETDLRYQDTGEATGDFDDNEWLTCTLRYQPVGGGKVAEQALHVDGKSWSETPGADWQLAAAVCETGMVLRDSEFKGTATLDSAAKLAKACAGGDEVREGLGELIELFKTNTGYEDPYYYGDDVVICY